ncbi:MAG: S1 family peptidase [Streptomycetales bacterium]
MSSRHSGRLPRVRLVAAVGAAVAGLGLAVPQAGAAVASSDTTGYAASAKSAATKALTSDAGIGVAAAERRIEAQGAQAALAGRLVDRLGQNAAGAYFDSATGDLMVNVVNAEAAETVRTAGARTRVVDHSTAELGAITTEMNSHTGVPNTSWGTDTAANQVVLTLGKGVSSAEAAELLAVARQHRDAVRVEWTSDRFRSYDSGGYPIFTGSGSRCSLGFNVTGGFMLTAGHCTEGFPTWFNFQNAFIGPTVNSSFPGNDYGRIRNDGGISQPGNVYLWNNSFQDITFSGNSVLGQSICKSGSTTGLTCGSVVAKNVTVNYGGGDIVSGLDQSNACASPGDSGGSWFNGTKAIGLTSGGNLACPGAQTFFQPVQEALNAFGVSVY